MEFVAATSGAAPVSLAGFTVVLPAVSTASLSQLAVEALLHNVPTLRLVGHVSHPGLAPFAGPLPPESKAEQPADTILTSMDVFADASLKLAVVQQRSPCRKSMRDAFLADLMAWLKSLQPASVVLMSGCDATQRLDTEMGDPLYFLARDHERGVAKKAVELGVRPLPPAKEATDTRAQGLTLVGGGITRLFFEKSSEVGLDTFVAVYFCAPGDNTGHAMRFAQFVGSLVEAVPSPGTWRIPFTWRLLYGNSTDPSLW